MDLYGFAKAQVTLKAVLLASSICVSISVDAFDYDHFRPIADQTILVRQERRMAQLGIGNPPISGIVPNFSSDFMFVLAAHRCASTRASTSGPISHIHWNARLTEQNDSVQYRPDLPHVECLPDQNLRKGPSTPPVLQTEILWEYINRKGLSQCDLVLPRLHEIKSGVFNVTVSKCPWLLTHFYC